MSRHHHFCWMLTTLCMGCAMQGRPVAFTAPAVTPPATGAPSQVTPQSDPTKVNKPAVPAGNEATDRAPESSAPADATSPADSARPADSATTNDDAGASTSDASPEQAGSPNVPDPVRPSSPIEQRWRPTAPADKVDAPRSLKPLDPPVRPPVVRDPSEVQLGDPAPFPALPNRDDSPTTPTRSEDADPGPVASGLSNISQTAAPAGPSRPSAWELSQQTTGGRPFQTARFSRGGNGTSVFITGSLSGLETESVQLLDQLLAQLQQGELPQANLFLLRTPNPDGIAEHTRTNLRGVDLNRNFPSSRFTATPNQLTGPHPASELETKAMLRLLREQSPQRVIHVRSSFSSRPLVLFNELAARRFAKVELPEHPEYAVLTGDVKAGALEEFTSLRMGIETITIMLPPDGFRGLSPDDLLKFVDLTERSAADSTGVATSIPQPKPDAATSPDVEISHSQTPDGQLGFVEFLPPPPEIDRSATTGDPRYYELPPPETQTSRTTERFVP
ncbi:MAG: succinylglutamate desuccinylase/aspartoacylase family protein [Planctomycetaceae bacterium]|nr:succinylglutamate desuccinylase/aspartoacylase family protein [Planctomycetaceae bacterium]